MDDAKILEAEKRGMETGFFAALKAAFSGGGLLTRDEAGGKEKKSEDSDEVAELKKEIARLKEKLKERTADDDDDKDKKKGEDEETEKEKKEKKDTGDGGTMDAATATRLSAAAGVLLPGYRPAKACLSSANAFKRDVLSRAYTADAVKTGVGRAIELFTGPNPDFATMEQATLDAAFIGAGSMIQATNNQRFADAVFSATSAITREDTTERFQKQCADMWNKQ